MSDPEQDQHMYTNPLYAGSNSQKQEQKESRSSETKFPPYKDGSTVRSQGHGTITFSDQTRGKAKPFLCVTHQDEPDHAIDNLMKPLIEKRHFSEPSLVLSVTGGAMSFLLSDHLQEALKEGLRNVVRRTNAWVVSGGTHTGVMKLTGELMDSYYSGEKHVTSPTIGIATLGVLSHREKLRTANGTAVKHGIKALRGTDLDPNHTHFILVDDGSVGKFGGEIAFRAKFERKICAKYHASAVTVVIQGGPNTLKTARNAVNQKTPLVIVNNSGGAADIIAYAYYFLHGAGSAYSAYTVHSLRQEILQKLYKKNPPPADTIDDLLEEAMECVLDSSKVHIFDLHHGGTAGFENQIFKAVSATQTDFKTKLKIALTFDRLDEMKRLLNEMPLKDTDREKEEILHELLKQALIQDRPAFVELLLRAGVKPSKMQPDSDAEKPHTGNNEVPAFHLTIEGLYKAEMKRNAESHLPRLVQLSYTDEDGNHLPNRLMQLLSGRVQRPDGKSHNFNVQRMWKVMWHLMDIDNHELQQLVIPCTNQSSRRDSKQTNDAEENALNMLFIWAVCLDRFELARVLWLRVERPIMNALIASRLLMTLSKHEALSGPLLAEERTKMIADAKRFEELAIGVLQACHNDDTHKTLRLLTAGDRSSPLHVAFSVESLRFLSHPATQKVLSTKWSGNLEHRLRVAEAAVGLLLPLSVPLYRYLTQEPEEEGAVLIEGERSAKQQKSQHRKRRPTRFCTIVARFYTAAATRFASDALSHLALSLIFSYYVLDEISPAIAWLDILLMVWFFAIVCEEFRQAREDGFKKYIGSLWNKLDVIILCLFLSGLAVRLSDLGNMKTQLPSKAIQAFTVVGLWVRLMRYYAASATLGPKLVMIAEMTKNVLTFVFLLLIFVVGYGVASQSLLYPNRPFHPRHAISVLYRPYFQIYGEFDLEALEDPAGCENKNIPFVDCAREEVRLVPAFFAVYILITNILLINLLIAMFNDTYSKVQGEAEALWHKLNYELYDEFRNKALLPAPVSLLSFFYRLCRTLFNACKHYCSLRKHDTVRPSDSESAKNESGNDSADEDTASTDNFERRCAKRYMENADAQMHRQADVCVLETRSEVTELRQDVWQILERLSGFQAVHDNHMSFLLSQSNGQPRSVTAPDYFASEVSSTPSAPEHFVPAIEYPQSHGTMRFPLKPEQVPWENLVPNYSPTEYTALAIVKQPSFADSPQPKGITFNKVAKNADGKMVNRQSLCGRYKLDANDRPINPHGRTGMTGRGLLGKWGVNQAVDVVVTRWKRTDDGSVDDRNGQHVLEFIAIRRKDTGRWAIPGGFMENGEETGQTTARKLLEEILNVKQMKKDLTETERLALDRLLKQSYRFHPIYSEDNRNTDNAWIETTCVNFHDAKGFLTRKLQLQEGDRVAEVKWLPVLAQWKLFASHNKLLKKVAEHHGAYF